MSEEYFPCGGCGSAVSHDAAGCFVCGWDGAVNAPFPSPSPRPCEEQAPPFPPPGVTWDEEGKRFVLPVPAPAPAARDICNICSSDLGEMDPRTGLGPHRNPSGVCMGCGAN